MAHGDEYLTHVVRLFCDHADSPMWFAIGPVDYSEARLSRSLETDLRAWEEDFSSKNDPFRSLRANSDASVAGWPSSADAWAHTNEGLKLAQRLADELGAEFEVETDADPLSKKKVRFRSGLAATNPAGASAFHERAERTADNLGLAGAGSGAYVPLTSLESEEQ